MSGSLAGLLYLQVVYAAIGVGLVALLGLIPSRRALLPQLGLAYMAGVASVGILAADLALADVGLGLVELTLLAVVLLGLGLWRTRGAEAVERSRPSRLQLAGAAGAGLALVVLLGHAARALAVRPLLEFDSWAIWGLKGRALYELGGTGNPVFTSDQYPPLQHPLVLPSLEAIAARAMGAFDGGLMHVQFVFLAAGFAWALWSLLRPRVAPLPAALTVLAVLAAKPVLEQLGTALADVPLAFFVALGLVALARWLATGERAPLVYGALFLGTAAITKSEGMMFALAAFVALGAAAALFATARLRGAEAAALFVVAAILPWRIFVAVHHLPVAEYRFGDLVSPGYLADHSDRAGPAASGLLERIGSGGWGLLLALLALGLAAALLARSYALAGFALAWLLLSYLGLVLIYWISNLPIDLALHWSGDRTIITLVVAGAALAPLLAAEAWPSAGAWRRR
ncbi:MAG: hypothetical protein QOE36_1072 [Gaiellaceae bacterium]|nr:hypothetical protein [Gaiellaceae bacterium]